MVSLSNELTLICIISFYYVHLYTIGVDKGQNFDTFLRFFVISTYGIQGVCNKKTYNKYKKLPVEYRVFLQK